MIDTSSIIVAIITALPPTLVAILALRNSRQTKVAIEEVHKTVNSRMSELLSATKGESHAEGMTAGKLEEREEVAQRKNNVV